MIDIYSKHDNMHRNEIFYAIICINNYIILCVNYMFSLFIVYFISTYITYICLCYFSSIFTLLYIVCEFTRTMNR